MHFHIVALTALALLSSPAPTQASQVATGTWAPIGVNWPTFSCTINCNGPTTRVPNSGTQSVSVPRFAGPGILVSVTVDMSLIVGGSYSGDLGVAGTFRGVTAEAIGTVSLSPPGVPSMVASATAIATGNANGSRFVGFGLNSGTGTAGPVTLPPSSNSQFEGSGSISLPIFGTFRQNAYPSGGSVLGTFALGGGATNALIRVTYHYWPEFFGLGGGTPGSTGQSTVTTSGTTSFGTPVTVQVNNALATTAAVMAASPTPNPIAIFGGTFFPFPPVVTVSGMTNGSGQLSVSFPWPGTTRGESVTFQFATLDAAGPSGLAMSDALRATTL